jgi:hypothetical protein
LDDIRDAIFVCLAEKIKTRFTFLTFVDCTANIDVFNQVVVPYLGSMMKDLKLCFLRALKDSTNSRRDTLS